MSKPKTRSFSVSRKEPSPTLPLLVDPRSDSLSHSAFLRLDVAPKPLRGPFTLGAAPTPGTTPVQSQSPSASNRKDRFLTSVAGLSDQRRYHESGSAA